MGQQRVEADALPCRPLPRLSSAAQRLLGSAERGAGGCRLRCARPGHRAGCRARGRLGDARIGLEQSVEGFVAVAGHAEPPLRLVPLRVRSLELGHLEQTLLLLRGQQLLLDLDLRPHLGEDARHGGEREVWPRDQVPSAWGHVVQSLPRGLPLEGVAVGPAVLVV